MYYLLGYKLLSESTDIHSDYTTSCSELAADNTFVLMVDGDVSFEPESVRLLLDQIRSSSKLGVVCGRIHPMGSGWYFYI